MEDDFVFPDRPADLCDPRCELPLRCADLVDVSVLEKEELDEFVDRALYDVCNSDALSLLEQETFDRVYSLVRGYSYLPTVARKRLTDGLCSNLGAVCASAASLLAGSGGGINSNPGAHPSAAFSSSSSSSSPAERAAQAALHRAALKAYVFFVSWLQAQADEEDKSASAALTNAAATAANAAANARGRKKKNGAADAAAARAGPSTSSITWTWDEGRPRVAAAMAALAGVDLRALWCLAAGASSSAAAASSAAQAQRVDAGLLSRWVGCSVALISSQSACRDRALRASLATALGAAAHGDHGGSGGGGGGFSDGGGGVSSQLETVAASLVDALRGRDGAHLPLPLAELAASVAASYGGDDRLAAEILRCVAGADPREYEGSAAAAASAASSGAIPGGVVSGEGAAAKAAGAFLVELAERMPRTVGSCVALLVPHLGRKAFAMRSGIVAMMAILVHKAFSDPAAAGGEGEGGGGGGGAADGDENGDGGENQQQEPRERSEPSAVTHARLRTKQHLLDILLERSRDKNPFTRARVLGAWAYLADRGSLPLGHWNAVTAQAAARLEDRVALVRKGALLLLTALMLYNPFGPVLPRERFAASASEYEAQLRAMEQEATAWERGSRGGEREAAAAAAHAAAANWREAAVKVEGGEAAPSFPVAPAAPAAVAASSEEEEPMLVDGDDDDDGDDDAAPPVTLDPAAEQLRALVASLRCAAAFSGQLAAALPTIVQLLASATLTDVTESLSALVCAARFEIDGAEPALRRALLLVFSREAGVPDAAVRAVAELRLAGRTPEAAAASLVELASGATLGELSALDEVMGRLLMTKPGAAAAAAAADASTSCPSSAEPLLRPAAAKALWPLAAALGRAALPSAPTRRAALPRLRGCLSLLASLAARAPRSETAAHVPTLLAAGFGVRDPACARAAADALSRLGGSVSDAAPSSSSPDAAPPALLSPEVANEVYKILVRVVLSPAPTKELLLSNPSASSVSCLGDGGWYGAANAALRALLALHPAPHAVAAEVLRAAAKRALTDPSAATAASAAAAAAAGAPDEGEATGAGAGGEGEKEGEQAPSLPPPQAGPLARLLFLASRVALAQLVAADSNARAARKRRLAAEDSSARAANANAAAAAAAAAEEEQQEEEEAEESDDDLAAVGGGNAGSAAGASSAAAAPDLDALRDAAEASVLSSRTAPGALAPLIVAACGSRDALAAAPCLRAAAPLALATLAAVDGRACAAHAGSLFAAAADAALAARARCSLVVASGDLAARHPNAIEPWTACLYAPLADGNPPEVRRGGLLILSHLVLNDMVKVRGHGAALAARLADRDPSVASLAALFFHELARRATAKGGNPVYNMLPDVLSSLAAAVVEEGGGGDEEAAAAAAAGAEAETNATENERRGTPETLPSSPSPAAAAAAAADSTAIPKRLSPLDFQKIMGVLLSHVGKERQADALVDKLVSRMGPEARPAAARTAAFCLASVTLSEKGARRSMELLPSYKTWCADEEVAAHLRAVAARARRIPKASAALKGDADAWEARVAAAGAEITGKRLSQEGSEEGEGGEGAEGRERGEGGEAQAKAERVLSAAVRRLSLVGGGGGDDEMAAGPSSPPVVAAVADENENSATHAAAVARGMSTAPALGEAGAAAAAGNVLAVEEEATTLGGAKHAAAAAAAAARRSVSVAVSAGVGGAAEAMQVTPLRPQRRVVSDDEGE